MLFGYAVFFFQRLLYSKERVDKKRISLKYRVNSLPAGEDSGETPAEISERITEKYL